MKQFKKKVMASLLSLIMLASTIPSLQLMASAQEPRITAQGTSSITDTIEEHDQADMDTAVTLAMPAEPEVSSVTLSVYQQAGQIKSSVNSQDSSPLLITEIVPATPTGQTYTYIEVYNNSNRDIDLKDYTLYYLYPAPSVNWLEWTFDGQNNPKGTNHHPSTSIILPSGKAFILWPGGTGTDGKKVSDFNKFYGTTLREGMDIIKVNHGGIHTTDERIYRIGKSADNIISTVKSNENGVDNPTKKKGYSNQYSYRLDGRNGLKFTQTAPPSPGSVDSSQIPDAPYYIDASGSNLYPITDGGLTYKTVYGIKDDVSISATVTGNVYAGEIIASLYYKQGDNEYLKLPMNQAAGVTDSVYTATISRELLWANQITWYVEATDLISYTRSDEHTSSVLLDLDYESVPPLIFTEVVPIYQTGLERTYAEVYNNSDSPINMGAYNLYYQYLNSSSAPKTWTISTPEVYIEPGKTLVLWLSDDADATVDKFNADYGTNLVENKDIVRINYSGFHATDWRRLSIGTSLETAFTHAEFNENNKADTASGSKRAVQYSFPRDPNNSGKSLKVSNQLTQSPGRVESWQVPPADKRVHFKGYPGYIDDGSSPVVEPVNVPKTVNEGEELFAAFDVSDTIGLAGMTISYRFDNETKFKSVYEKTQRVKGKYFARIPANEMLNHDKIEFYVEGYNMFRKTTTAPFTVDINRLNAKGLRLNVGNGKAVSGTTTITANNGGDNKDTRIFVDGQEVKTTPVLENGAFLSLIANDQNNYFKNAVTAPYGGNDREIISYLGKWTNLNSRAVFIDNKYFQVDGDGNYSVKLTVWAGGPGTAFEDIYKPDINREDFTVSNVKLVLANGKEFTAARAVQDYRYSGDSFYQDVTEPGLDKIYNVGDSKNGKMAPSLDLYFTIPKENLTAVGYKLDTKTMTDGEHEIKATAGTNSQIANIKVDNTAPVIDAGIRPDEVISGTLLINPAFTDDHGIDISQLFVTLDDSPIMVPYSLPTRQLSPGTHTLQVSVQDVAGNKTQKTVTFKTDTKDPVGVKVQTLDISQNRAKLSALVEELNDSSGSVEFMKGRMLTVENGDITIKQGYGDSSVDVGKELTVVAPDGDLPYQLFHVKAGSLAEQDLISANWNGSASYADNKRALSMYVLNIAANKWELLARADDQGNIQATFAAKDHVENGHAVLLVQCRADDNPILRNHETMSMAKTAEASGWDGKGRPENYDFSLAWITDTQYYSESWPHHYLEQNQWLVDNAKEWDIRYTIHTGDIVDEWDMDDQWQLADKAMKIFEDNGMRYGVLGGNHDVGAGLEYYDNYWKYFGEHRFKNEAIYGGSYNNNLGHYDLLTEDGQDLIILYMSWDIYTDEINWMNDVLKRYSDRKAIIATHRYTNSKFADGNPDGLLDYQGYVLREQVVAKNPNVVAVLNGHYHGASIQIDGFDDDQDGIKERLVYQICTDYQSDAEGGSQYMKFLYFDLKNNKIYMNSYSPYRKDFNYYDEPKLDDFSAGVRKSDYDIYELDVAFDAAPKSLSTNRFSASIYTQDSIGKMDLVTGKAELPWNNLSADSVYSWYAKVTNGRGGVSITPVQAFRTAREPDRSDDGDDSNPGPGSTFGNPSSPVVPVTPPPSSVEIKINGKPVQAKKNVDGSISVSKSDLANTTEGKLVLGMPAVLKAGQNPNALVTVLKDDGSDIIVPFSMYSNDLLTAFIDKAGDYGVLYNLKSFGDISSHWAEKDITFVTSREIFQGVKNGEFAPDGTMTRAMFVTALARLDGANLTRYQQSRFGDVAAGQWYRGSVEWAAEHGIVSGVSSTRFDPDAPVTREQMTVMLHNFMKYKGYKLAEKTAAEQFQDSGTVSPWAADSVGLLQRTGMISGKPGHVFDPQGMSTRAEVSTIFARFISELVR